MMKGLTNWIILALVIAFCIPAVSAFSVSSISIDPSGSLTPGTPVTVAFKVDGAGTGEDSPDLRFFTDLENQKWTYTILVDGVENPRPVQGGKTLDISGFELAYKPSQEVALKMTLEGTTPSVTTTIDKTIIRITESDTTGRQVESTKVERTAKVINTAEVAAAIAAKRTDLQTFRSHIDEKSAIGIDTSAAEAKYNDAKGKIDTAAALPSNQYSAAIDSLNAAQTTITEGEKALELAWAELEVAGAQVPINNVDGVIAWFKGNQSTANDPGLPVIITKREVAVSYISNANDEISSGNYAQARVKAQEAFTKGNESYTEALALQYKVTHGFSIDIPGMITGIFKPGLAVIVVGVIVVVLIVVGVVIYRKRSRWDELG